MRRLALVTACLLAATAAGFAGAALAVDTFPDVPDASAFHDEVGEFGTAECADGFPDGTFRPTEPVKRQQMARFFTRCGGRVATFNDSQAVSDSLTTVVSTQLTAPATGLVVVTAGGSVQTTDFAGCPCQVGWTLGNGELSENVGVGQLDDQASGDGAAWLPLSGHAVFEVTRGETSTYSLRVGHNQAAVSAFAQARITVLFVPFGSVPAG